MSFYDSYFFCILPDENFLAEFMPSEYYQELTSLLNKNLEILKKVHEFCCDDLYILNLLDDAEASIASLQKRIDAYEAAEWQQNADADIASMERHDLYGDITKINFGVEAIMLTYAEKLSQQAEEYLQRLLGNNKWVYTQLKEKFQAS